MSALPRFAIPVRTLCTTCNILPGRESLLDDIANLRIYEQKLISAAGLLLRRQRLAIAGGSVGQYVFKAHKLSLNTSKGFIHLVV